MRLKIPLVLASSSPRRRRLLVQLGLEFTVDPSDVEEVVPPEVRAPRDVVEYLAEHKAGDVAPRHPDALVLAADTVVVLGERLLGKPAGPREAAEMLRSLSGNEHTVYTGLALAQPASGRLHLAHEATRVRFGALAEEEIEAYVASGAPFDKAGGYGIQSDLGAVFVSGITGDYFNVVGLPLHRLYRTLRSHFADLLVF